MPVLKRLIQGFGEFGNRLEQIRDKAVVGDLEDGGFLVLVDCDDDLAVLHASGWVSVSVCTRMPRSAPIASAVRSVSWDATGPTEQQ